MIPRHIHWVWFGEAMPQPLRRMTLSVWQNNPEFEFSLWCEKSPELGLNIPKLKDRLGSWAAVSNYARLVMLQKYGGIYLDCDVECLRPLDSLLGHSAFAAEQDGGRICNAVMGAEPNHPWVNWQLEHFDDFDQRDPASGVYLATEAAKHASVSIVPQHLVYPFLYDTSPEQRVPHPDSLLVHHWHGSWSKKP